MATNLRVPKFHLPAIPSSRVVRERLKEVETLAKRLGILLRVATELEQAEQDDNKSDESEGGSIR